MKDHWFTKLIEQVQDILQGILDYLGGIMPIPQHKKNEGHLIPPYRPQSHLPSKVESRTTVISVRQIEYKSKELSEAQIYRNTPYPKIKRPPSTNKSNIGQESV